jgi:hypothetical protein
MGEGVRITVIATGFGEIPNLRSAAATREEPRPRAKEDPWVRRIREGIGMRRPVEEPKEEPAKGDDESPTRSRWASRNRETLEVPTFIRRQMD